MKEEEAGKLVEHFRKAAVSASEALQMLCRVQADVPGTKPAMLSEAYDGIKWASAIYGLSKNTLEE